MFEKVTDRIFAITDGQTVGNVGLIATDAGNYLIDTSMYPVIARNIRQEIQKIKTGKLSGGFFTHYHFDHTGGAQEFHDVPMYAHELTKDNFNKSYGDPSFLDRFADHPQKELFEGLRVTPPSYVFSEKKFEPEGTSIEVYHVGGHTSGSSIIVYRPENVVFAGDNLFVGRYPWGGDPTASPYDWKHSMELILSLDPNYIVPGHGSVTDNVSVVKKYAEYLDTIIETGEKLAKEGVGADKAVEELTEVDFFEEMREGMKIGTLKRWYEVIWQKR